MSDQSSAELRQILQTLAERGLYVVTSDSIAVLDAAERWYAVWVEHERELGDPQGVVADLFHSVKRWKGKGQV